MRMTVLAATVVIVSGTLILLRPVTSIDAATAAAEPVRAAIDIMAITRNARDLPTQHFDAF